MAGVAGRPETLGDVLASRRRRSFVGRSAEMELIAAALDGVDPPFAVLHVHGPGGVGKTSLLDVVAELAAETGATVVRLDGCDVLPSPTDVLAVLGEVLDVPAGEGAITGPLGRVVVLLDTYERLAPLDDWVRTRLLPRLPATALTVLAGRMPPSPAWRADAAWRDLLRIVALRNFSPEESRTYLHVGGVDPVLHERILAVTHGHPLGLSLLADVACGGGEVVRDSLSPDLVGTLL